MSILCKSIELSAEMVEMEIKKNGNFNEKKVVGRDERICNSDLFVPQEIMGLCRKSWIGRLTWFGPGLWTLLPA